MRKHVYDDIRVQLWLTHLVIKKPESTEWDLTHPLRVAQNVRWHAREALSIPRMEEAFIAAVLHDAVEDGFTTLADINANFGSAVGSLVLELTNYYTKDRFPNLRRDKRKVSEFARLKWATLAARIIKACDRLDNIASIVVRKEKGEKFAHVYAIESAQLLLALNYSRDLPAGLVNEYEALLAGYLTMKEGRRVILTTDTKGDALGLTNRPKEKNNG